MVEKCRVKKVSCVKTFFFSLHDVSTFDVGPVKFDTVLLRAKHWRRIDGGMGGRIEAPYCFGKHF